VLPDFSCDNIPKREINVPNKQKINQMAIKYNKWPLNLPNAHTIRQHLPLQDHAKIYPNLDFGFENLADLKPTSVASKDSEAAIFISRNFGFTFASDLHCTKKEGKGF
jgi:hypothetical protein